MSPTRVGFLRAMSDAGLKPTVVYHNLTPAELYEKALKHEPGTHVMASGALAALSGAKTGRSPKDKRVVREPSSENDVWWATEGGKNGSPNFEMDEHTFLLNRERAVDYLNMLDRIYVFDGYAGWDEGEKKEERRGWKREERRREEKRKRGGGKKEEKTNFSLLLFSTSTTSHHHHLQSTTSGCRIKVRVVCARAYHALFMHNMLIRPTEPELATFGAPDFTIFNAGAFPVNRYTSFMSSSTSIDVNLKAGEMVILGTQYAGEMKKGIFSVMHYLMPKRGVLSLHSGCNLGASGDVTLFFGLSGTGKTTLSTDPARPLIGDDEHCWSDDGVFNIEGEKGGEERRKRMSWRESERETEKKKTELSFPPFASSLPPPKTQTSPFRRLLRQVHRPQVGAGARDLEGYPLWRRARERRLRRDLAPRRLRLQRRHREHAGLVPDRAHRQREDPVRWPAPAQPGAAVLRRVWGAAAGKMIFFFCERRERKRERFFLFV